MAGRRVSGRWSVAGVWSVGVDAACFNLWCFNCMFIHDLTFLYVRHNIVRVNRIEKRHEDVFILVGGRTIDE